MHRRRTCRGGSRCASRLATACEAPTCGECTARMMADSIAGGMTGSTPLAPGMDSPTEASRIRPPVTPQSTHPKTARAIALCSGQQAC